jgi:hypothetical protein
MAPLMFGATGVAPIGYAALAFTLGVTTGVLIRRTLPAMAIVLAVFAAVQVLVPGSVRAHLSAPLVSVLPATQGTIQGLQINGNQIKVFTGFSTPGAWVLSNDVITRDGQGFGGPAPVACTTNAPFSACARALSRLHLRQRVIYQPANRYWAFQWFEMAIYLVVALALAGFCFWRVRLRRVA